MKLHYKASNIARAEQALGANFFDTLQGLGEGTPSFTALLMILRAGGLTEAEADQMLDDKGLEDSLKTAIEALGQAGFLAKMAANQVDQEPSQPEVSQDTGKQTKA